MKQLHYSVLLNECIEGLNIKENGKYVDATVGYAGHSKNILAKIKKGHLFAFDEDEAAVKYSKKVLSSIGDNFTVFRENFVNMPKVLKDSGIEKVNGILFDLGFSSPQIDDASRGFSFMLDAPLDMRMDNQNNLTAQMIVNTYSKEELIRLFIVSDVTIINGQNVENKVASVKVSRHDGIKCDRCRNYYHEDEITEVEGTHLCSRCLKAIEK